MEELRNIVLNFIDLIMRIIAFFKKDDNAADEVYSKFVA